MASRHFECGSLPDQFLQAARSGDWDTVERLTAALAGRSAPQDPDALRERLRDLGEMLIVAKACRAGLHATANRLSAAALFQTLARDASGFVTESQNPGVPTES